MAVCDWCGQAGAEVASCCWLVPLRRCDLTEAIGSGSNGGGRWLTHHRRYFAGMQPSGGRSSAVEASRRFQGSWDTGKAPGRAARRGEHAGGRRACRRAPERRCEVAAVAPSSGEARVLTVWANGCVLNPNNSTVRCAKRRGNERCQKGAEG